MCICEHIMSFLLTDASRGAGNMWPLGNDQLRVIIEHFEQLIQFLDSGDDLIFSLIGTDCFTSRQIDALKCIPDVSDRNAKLLKMLKRRGDEHFNQFLHCLNQTQRHLLPLFTRDTGMGRLSKLQSMTECLVWKLVVVGFRLVQVLVAYCASERINLGQENCYFKLQQDYFR